ncbi:MAG: TonB-dependent receptor [Woeseiaceae bacterium]|nr:TonB-dependent receptor [Woeseiaceae bacterium]
MQHFDKEHQSKAGYRTLISLAAAAAALISGAAFAQEDDEDTVDEITVTGTQIKGAKISDALAVSVIDSEAIEIIGVESGDELLDMIPEMGQNFFSETDTAGGVNAARGDVGAINMRNLGTGNTLVLLNGRRLVNMATYQTETVGGSFVPVNSVNSNHIPVFGVDRIEVLRDGASAIYGADAVAGVVNTVLKDDYEGFRIRARHTNFDHLPRDDQSIGIEWGDNFNGGATNVGVFVRYYQRDSVNSQDEARWAEADFRYRFGDGSTAYGAFQNPLANIYGEDSGSTVFRNDSANSVYGRFDVIPGLGSSHSLRQNDVTDNAGEFELFPIGAEECTASAAIDLGNGICMREDAGSRGVRYNLNDNRDLLSELERTTVYAYLNHEFDSGLEFFGDMYYYTSTTKRLNAPSVDLSAVPLRVGASNYYNPLGPVGSPNRLPDAIIGTDVPAEGYELNMDLYRFEEFPRVVNNDGDSYRLLAGLRGTAGDWDWESAVVYSEATRDDITNNRISNTLITEALFDPTPAAYNPFAAGVDSNIERALVDVFRKGETTLAMWDIKFSNPEIYELPAGPVGILAGYEFRKEEYVDDRDPRLDGTIRFQRDTDGDGVLDFEGDFEGDTYPFTSDVVNSSPTPDGAGDRTTNSLFFELQIPVLENLDVQLATRYEDFDDIGDTTVSKFAFGYRPFDQLLIRGSWSEAFRAPNLITINEQIIARSNTLNDYACFYGEDQGTLDDDCDYGIQRRAQGSTDLVPEESDNTSIGVVITPIENLTITADFWSIEKENTIGLFGEENHILYDLVLRLQAGTSNCGNELNLGNPVVVRTPHDPTDTDLVNGYLAAGLCPIGRVDFVDDKYLNLDTRELEGYDIGVYYDFDTEYGEFSLSYNGSFYTKFEQIASSTLSVEVEAAKAADSTIVYPLTGLGDLLGLDGNQEDRHSASIAWRKGDLSASLQAFKISGFNEELSNGDLFRIPSMTTYNTKVDYRFELQEIDTRVRLGVNNITDERAPIADESFGFFKDAHRDWGIYYYLDLMVSF